MCIDIKYLPFRLSPDFKKLIMHNFLKENCKILEKDKIKLNLKTEERLFRLIEIKTLKLSNFLQNKRFDKLD